jgi:dephospho-CoA kinase
MLGLRKVAITGGIACGKSSVSRFFKELGAYVVSADEIVHQLLSSDSVLGQKVITLLGSDIVVKGHIDRSKVAKKVFEDPTLLKTLEKYLHPAVREEMDKRYQEVQQSTDYSLFVAEIPLLFETGGNVLYDHTIVVTAPKETCQRRFEESTGYSAAEFDQRASRQQTIEEKAKKADFVICNDGTLPELKEKVKALHRVLTSKI